VEHHSQVIGSVFDSYLDRALWVRSPVAIRRSRFCHTTAVPRLWGKHANPTGLHASYRNGVPDEEIMGDTRHRSLTTMPSYVRRAKLGRAGLAGKIGL
jgi:hypothetical protein